MKIGIVNDSPMALRAIARTLETSSGHQVLWLARSGEEALNYCLKQLPELVLMDMVMPGLNGAETTRQIIHKCPTTILVVTASVEGNCGLAFQAMGEGALDVIATPRLNEPREQAAFLKKINQIATLISTTSGTKSIRIPKTTDYRYTNADNPNRLVIIGCSAGGPAASAEILRHLPGASGAAVVILQHIDAGFVTELAGWLGNQSKWPVRVANEGEVLFHGTVWLAGATGHLLLDKNAQAHYSTEPSQLSFRPSIDVLLNSIAGCWQGNVIAVILTGMGNDGAQGLLALRKRGFVTFAQDQQSSAIFGMPKAAAECGAATEVLSLQQITARITEWIEKG